ncbi:MULTISPECIES: hypothetical protein [Bacteria]|jgi:hypothetical protein|uniref:hypothetical protein n=1 Tax=Bacteria TaxID=2 RepID=UPI003701F11B
MNVQHPFRAQFGALAEAVEPLPSASEAMVRLESSLAILDSIAEAALTAVHHLERAAIAGAGQRADMGRLEDVAAKLGTIALRAEAARSRVSDKLAGAR